MISSSINDSLRHSVCGLVSLLGSAVRAGVSSIEGGFERPLACFCCRPIRVPPLSWLGSDSSSRGEVLSTQSTGPMI